VFKPDVCQKQVRRRTACYNNVLWQRPSVCISYLRAAEELFVLKGYGSSHLSRRLVSDPHSVNWTTYLRDLFKVRFNIVLSIFYVHEMLKQLSDIFCVYYHIV